MPSTNYLRFAQPHQPFGGTASLAYQLIAWSLNLTRWVLLTNIIGSSLRTASLVYQLIAPLRKINPMSFTEQHNRVELKDNFTCLSTNSLVLKLNPMSLLKSVIWLSLKTVSCDYQLIALSLNLTR